MRHDEASSESAHYRARGHVSAVCEAVDEDFADERRKKERAQERRALKADLKARRLL